MSDYPPPPGEIPPGLPPPPGGGAPGGETLPQRSIGEILSAAWQIYTKNAAQLIVIVAAVVVPLSVISWLLVDVLFAPKEKTEIILGQPIRVESRAFIVFLLATLVALAIAVIINAILQAALLRGAALATVGDPVDINDSYRWGLRRFGSVLVVSLLVGLAVAIGFLLLIIPGIIFLVMFSVAVPALVVEGVRGTDAMRRSWNLVKGHFWHVFGVIVVAAILTGIVSGILGAIGGSNSVLRLIFGTIAQVLVAPFSALIAVLLYLDVRSRSENLTASTLRAELGRNV
jgi:hypothetical protein